MTDTETRETRYRGSELRNRLGPVEDGKHPSRITINALADQLGLGERSGELGHRFYSDSDLQILRRLYAIRNTHGRSLEEVVSATQATLEDLVAAETREIQAVEEYYASIASLRNWLAVRER